MAKECADHRAFVAGVDGCKAGWVIASETARQEIAIDIVSCFSEVMDRDYRLLVVDVPIGLLDHGTRLADQEARRILRKRACCVFTAPLRPILECVDYSKARELRLQIEGKSITRQAWAIVPKIKEVDEVLAPDAQSRIREGHPEVSFALMNGGEALTSSKHSTKGRRDRMGLLTEHFPEIPFPLHPLARIKVDAIDACALLWTARCIRNNQALVLPEKSTADRRGLLMQIWV